MLARESLLAALFCAAIIAGVISVALDGVNEWGWMIATLNTFDISAIVWAAFFIGLLPFFVPGSFRANRLDWVVGLCMLPLIIFPYGPLAWVALVIISIYAIATFPRSSLARAGAWVLLAATVPLLWSKVFFALFSDPILKIDAVFISWFVGTERIGNLVGFADGSGYFQILPGCSSLANTSLAFLCWTLFSQVRGRPLSWSGISWCLAACFSTMTLNVVRIGLIGRYPEYYDLLHGPYGASAAGYISLGVTVLICWWGTRPVEKVSTEAAYLALAARAKFSFPKGALGMLLVVTGIVAVTEYQARQSQGRFDFSLRNADVAAFLQENDFTLLSSPASFVIEASNVNGDWIALTQAREMGWNQTALRETVGPTKDFFLVYGGRPRDQYPLSATFFLYFDRLLIRAGLDPIGGPVWAIAADPAVRARELPWEHFFPRFWNSQKQ